MAVAAAAERPFAAELLTGRSAAILRIAGTKLMTVAGQPRERSHLRAEPQHLPGRQRRIRE